MSKLLTEPRVPKSLEVPKKKVRRIKKVKQEGDPIIKCTILYESNKDKVEELLRLYNKDSHKARVKFFSGIKEEYSFTRIILFEHSNGEFQICNKEVRLGISVSNRKYTTEKSLSSISYKKGRFWFVGPGGVKPLGLNHIESMGYMTSNKLIENYFADKFHWYKTLKESPVKHHLRFNSIVLHKLFGLNDMSRYVMKAPHNIAKMVLDSYKIKQKNISEEISNWRNLVKDLDGIENLKLEFFEKFEFKDSCRMARILGKKVNCRWGIKRLTEEHDKWAKEITRTLLDCVDEYELKIRPEFLAFEEFSGFQLLKTNKDMLKEGMLQNHCVGTYISKVMRGECAIFHVDGYTLEVQPKRFDKNMLTRVLAIELEADEKRYKNLTYHIIPMERTIIVDGIPQPFIEGLGEEYSMCLINAQFRGKHNQSAPKELVDMVNQKLIDFVNRGELEQILHGEKNDNKVGRYSNIIGADRLLAVM